MRAVMVKRLFRRSFGDGRVKNMLEELMWMFMDVHVVLPWLWIIVI